MRVPVAPKTWSQGQDTKQGFPFYLTPLHKHRLGKVAAKAQTPDQGALGATLPRPLLDISPGSPQRS